MVPEPDRGRRYTKSRKVRLGDADRHGRLRLDALARFLQDVANDDARDGLGEDASSWVVRKTEVEVHAWPRFGEVVTLTTFCGGVGGRSAERRTSVRGSFGGHVECASVWVHLDLRTGRPQPLPARFLPLYGEVYGDRRVSGRLSLPAPPAASTTGVPWPLRATDFDVMGHVNNAAYWDAVEDAFAGNGIGEAGRRFDLEYKAAIEPDHAVVLVVDGDAGLLWLVAPGTGDVHAAARMGSLDA